LDKQADKFEDESMDKVQQFVYR